MADAYIGAGELPKALNVLKELRDDDKESFRTKIMWGKYFEASGDIAAASKYFMQSIKDSKNHQSSQYETVEFFFRANQFKEAIELLSEIVQKDMSAKVILRDYVYGQLAKAHHLNKDHCTAIEIALQGIAEGVPREALRDVLSESYMHLKKYRKAREIYEEIYEENPNNYDNLLRLGISLSLTGNVEDCVPFFDRAEKMAESKDDSVFCINYSQVNLLIGDKPKALQYAGKAKDIDWHNPQSPAHQFYLHMTMRCGDTDTTVRYMVDFHETYPKEAIVQKIKALDEDETGQRKPSDEFMARLKDMEERFKFGIDYYKSQPMPLYFLAHFFHSSITEIWHWRNIYGLPIYIDSGNPTLQRGEAETLKKTKSLLVDSLTLQIMNHLGLIDVFLQEFGGIIIPQSLFDEIQNTVINVHDPETRQLWNALRKHPTIVFATRERDDDFLSEEFFKAFGESGVDGLNIAKESGYTYCIGDERLKRFAHNEGIEVTGIYAVIMDLLDKGRIGKKTLAVSKSRLIKENHGFVSFNVNDLISLTEDSNYIMNKETECFFDVILKTEPNIMSFIKVYIGFIVHLFENNVDSNIIATWMSKHVQVFQKLYARAYAVEKSGYILNKPPKHAIPEVKNLSLRALRILSSAAKSRSKNQGDTEL